MLNDVVVFAALPVGGATFDTVVFVVWPSEVYITVSVISVHATIESSPAPALTLGQATWIYHIRSIDY